MSIINKKEPEMALTSLKLSHIQLVFKQLVLLYSIRYEYCTFYSQKKDIFEFFDWLRKNKYTLEIQGDLFDFADDRSHVDFHGNVCEYSAVFHYRIYSRELFGHIINQLRTVKRYHAWHKRREIR